jgi:hypothetical protein
LSDSLPDGHVDAMSWAAVLIEITGAFAFGAAGLHAMTRRGRASRPASQSYST